MAVYNKGGTALSSIYTDGGYEAYRACDVNGVEVFRKGLKLCTYNVGGWYIGSGTNVPAAEDAVFYDLQNSIISSIDADVLVLEEFWTQFSKAGRSAASFLSQYYPYIQTADGSATYTGRAICSKYPIESYTQHTFSGESRYYDEAVITIDGKTIHFFVTHLHPSDQTVRVAEAAELCNYVKTLTDDFIIGGDFNNIIRDPLSTSNEAIYRQFLDYGCSMANGGALGILDTACNSANWTADKFPIDQILTSSAFSVASVATNLEKVTNPAVLATGKIDHIPFYATIVYAEE